MPLRSPPCLGQVGQCNVIVDLGGIQAGLAPFIWHMRATYHLNQAVWAYFTTCSPPTLCVSV